MEYFIALALDAARLARHFVCEDIQGRPIATDRTTPPQPRAGEPARPDELPDVPPDRATLWLRFPQGTCPDAASVADVVGAATDLTLHRKIAADDDSFAADVMFDTAIFRISGPYNTSSVAIRPAPDSDAHTLSVAAQWTGCAAALMAGWPDCIAALWSPSGQLRDRAPFLTAIAQWQTRGVLPLRFLVALTPADDGRIRTTGLSAFHRSGAGPRHPWRGPRLCVPTGRDRHPPPDPARHRGA